MKRIGVVTSGGDAPGMNAAIRAVVRTAFSKEIETWGYMRGWEGLLANTFTKLTPRSVGGILQLGGTILNTSRCPEFREKQAIDKAAHNLASDNIDGLVVIGGNGSFRGAFELSRKTDTIIVGLPATIDNDVFGVDETIGFDSAVNTAVANIDKIRDTAISHERIFVVEVMGRKRGFLASVVGLTAGAEVILVPEVKHDRSKIFKTLKQNSAKGKKSGIIVTAEGVEELSDLANEIAENTGAEVRYSSLGYAQRGGNPTARSRLLASLFANGAVELLSEKRGDRIVGLREGKVTGIALEKSCKMEKPLELNMLKLADILAI